MKDLAFHEIANFWPMMEGEPFDNLVEDICEHGQRVPIEVWEGKVIDGRNRYRACLLAGVEPYCVEIDLGDEDPIAYVRSLNDHRRHMTASQLSICAAKARKWYDEEAKKRMREGGEKAGKGRPQQGVESLPPPIDKGKARDKAGKAFGVSGRYVDAATRVLERCPESVSNAVAAGKISVMTAEKMSSLPAAMQEEWLSTAKGKPYKHPLPEPDELPVSDKPGVGVIKANEAVNALSRIPRNDPLRKRGFQIVTDWIRKNK